VLLADIQNETKEAAFDSTLRQALSIQLEQSPSLSLVSDQEIQHLLAMMKQPKTAHLSPELAWELCQRGGNTVVIYPSIANLADQYILGLRALDCRTGNSLANQQSAATGKDHVLQAVDEAATELRRRLGESLPQLQRYNTPIEQATTPSLAALQAYSVGWLMQYRRGDSAGAVAFFQRAVQLDPGFAMAYAALGQTYSNRYEPAEAAKYLKRAYALREHVTERERFYIESRYERAVSGDLEKARLVNQQWAQVYPLDAMPRTSLALIDRYLGQYDRALSEASEANRLAPDSSQGYANLAFSYLLLNRLDEAKAVDDEAQARNLDSPLVRLNLYFLASLRNDRSAVEQLDAWSAGQAGVEDRFLNQKSLDLAHDGHISKALDVSQAAVASALRTGARETAAGYEAAWAVLEGIVGNDTDARRYATAALALAQDRDSEFWAALAMAMAADNARAQALGDSLSKELPEDTAVRFCFVPTIRAQLALNAGNAAQAIEILEATRPYELGKVTGLYPVYIRGEALRSVQRLDEAAVEFQKIIDRPGVVLNDPIGELALLQLARVYAAQGLREKAATAYQGFLAPWQEAGTSIPLVAKAQSELAGLKSIGP
jgi:tetratricopeptide (TPR) repeat protein